MNDSINYGPSTLTRTWSDYDNKSNYEYITENVIVLPWIATVIIILLSFSSIRLKLFRWIKGHILGVDDIDNEEIGLVDVLFQKIESVRCVLFRSKSREIETMKGKQLQGTESKLSKKDDSKSTLKNIALASTNYGQNTSQQSQTISYDTNLEPAFLNEEDYPEDWLTYDPIRGLISRNKLKELREREHSQEANE